MPSAQIQRNNRVRNANPFDYRGYYYDTETGLYYCQSRYYDPDVGRWLNADIKIGAGYYFRGYNLFAYCLNDPVGFIDPTGEKSHIWYKDIIDGVLRELNYKYNKSNDVTGELIYGQASGPAADMKYGITTIEHVGCEVISVYNAMILLGMEASMADLIYDFQIYDAMWIEGTMGSKPAKIGDVLSANSLSFTTCNSLNELYSNISIGNVFILSFWINANNIFEGLHTVAVLKTWNKEPYMIFNSYNGDTEPRLYASLEERIGNGKFIIAYALGNILPGLGGGMIL